MPDIRTRESGATVPFRAVGAGGGGEGVAEIVGAEEGGDDGIEDDGAEGFHASVRFGDDEIDVPRVRSAAAVGATDSDFNLRIFHGDGVADNLAVMLNFLAGNAGSEIIDMFYTNFLVLG